MADWSDHEWKLLIGGELVDGANGTSPIVNPATEEVVGHAPEASVDQALDAAAAARKRFPAWSATPGGRARRAARAGRRPAHASTQADLVPLIIAETGATLTVGSRMQVPVAIERFERYARGAVQGPRHRRSPPSDRAATPLAPGALMGAYVNRQPVGVVACISPYNFPLTNMAGKIAPGARRGLHGRDEARAAGPAGDPRARRRSCTRSGSRPAWSTSSRRPRPSPRRRSPSRRDVDMVSASPAPPSSAQRSTRPAATR